MLWISNLILSMMANVLVLEAVHLVAINKNISEKNGLRLAENEQLLVQVKCLTFEIKIWVFRNFFVSKQ
jgi:hypothetical protein